MDAKKALKEHMAKGMKTAHQFQALLLARLTIKNT